MGRQIDVLREIHIELHLYLVIMQCLCNNYSSTQKVNEVKENNLRNKHTHMFFDNQDEDERKRQAPNEFKIACEKIGKERKSWKCVVTSTGGRRERKC